MKTYHWKDVLVKVYGELPVLAAGRDPALEYGQHINRSEFSFFFFFLQCFLYQYAAGAVDVGVLKMKRRQRGIEERECGEWFNVEPIPSRRRIARVIGPPLTSSFRTAGLTGGHKANDVYAFWGLFFFFFFFFFAFPGGVVARSFSCFPKNRSLLARGIVFANAIIMIIEY